MSLVSLGALVTYHMPATIARGTEFGWMASAKSSKYGITYRAQVWGCACKGVGMNMCETLLMLSCSAKEWQLPHVLLVMLNLKK